MSVFVLKTGLVDERLDHRQREVAGEGRDGDHEDVLHSNQALGLGQEVRNCCCNENTGCDRHERMQPMSEAQCRDPASEGREERKERGDRHLSTLNESYLPAGFGRASLRRGGERRPVTTTP